MNKFKSVILAIMITLLPIMTQAQTSEVKVNLLAGAITIFNPSIEIGFGKASAITMDYVGAFAEEDFMNSGYPFLFTMGVFGYRHYFSKKEDHRGFFLSGDFGLDQFRMNKNIIPLVVSDHGLSGYDVGYGMLLGVTAGYKYNINKHLNIEGSISGGWHLAHHECYNSNGVRTVTLNPSGEWTPYKAGIYISYIFGS